MAKPEKITISQLVQKSSCSRAALFKKCSRASKKKDSLIYVNGSGWYSITKPGKEYVLYLIQADSVPDATIKNEVENNVKQLFNAVDGLVCEECSETVNELKLKILQ